MLPLLLQKSVLGAGQQGEVPEFTALRIAKAPIQDGFLDDDTWRGAALYGNTASGFISVCCTRLAYYQPVVFAAWDSEFLYLAAILHAPNTVELKMDSREERFSWSDDLVQFFIEPQLDGYFVYYAVNPKGITTCNDVFSPGVVSNERLDKGFSAGTGIKDIYWTAELSISWNTLGIKPEPGMRVGFNIVVNQTARQDGWSSWSGIYGSALNPARFGYLFLGDYKYIPILPRTSEEDDF